MVGGEGSGEEYTGGAILKARDLKPGWFFSESDGALQMAIRLSECGHMWSAIAHGSKVLIQLVGGNIEVTHHPDCTGWDWERPKLQPAIDPGDGWWRRVS